MGPREKFGGLDGVEARIAIITEEYIDQSLSLRRGPGREFLTYMLPIHRSRLLSDTSARSIKVSMRSAENWLSIDYRSLLRSADLSSTSIKTMPYIMKNKILRLLLKSVIA